MPILYLHIGVARTGTTFLQDSLYANRHLLAQQGYVFPILPAGVETALIGLDIFRGSREHTALFRERIERHPDHHVIVSNEMIYKNICELNDIHLLKYVLEEFGREIKVICYVRRQDEAIVSGYPIEISRGRREPLTLDAKGSNAAVLDYHKILKRWRQVFGPENVIIRRFGRSYFREGRLEADFAGQIGLDISGFEFVENTNKSFNADAVEIVRRLNENQLRMPHDTLNFLRSQIFPLGERKPVGISREERLAFLERFEKSNQALAKQFLGLEGPLFDHDVPDNATPLTNDSVLPIMFELLNILPIAIPEDASRVNAKNLYFLAKQHIAAREHAEALVLLEEIVDQHADENIRPMGELQWRIASCSMKLGDKEAALRILRTLTTDDELDDRTALNCRTLAGVCGDQALADKFEAIAESRKQ